MSAPATGEPVLVVPPDLVVPDAAVARLRRQFGSRPDGVVGIAAPVCDLAPGSSTTTAAERAAMAPLAAAVELRDLEVRGAVLLDASVPHRVAGNAVTLDAPDGTHLLLDPGACAFDPRATGATPDGAAIPAPTARPPFRWRPVVLVLATEPHPDLAGPVADLADRLLDLDVEARLALADPLTGPARIAPCAPVVASLDALAPDVIVVLDPGAGDLADGWPAMPRSTVVVELDASLDDRIELVPWTIDVAVGRLRARIGPAADAGPVARLVNRLAAGPLPGPPTDGPDPAGADPAGTDPVAEPGTEVALPGDEGPVTRPTFSVDGDPDRADVAGFADALARRGHRPAGDGSAGDVDLVLVTGALAADGTVLVGGDPSGPTGRRRVLLVASGGEVPIGGRPAHDGTADVALTADPAAAAAATRALGIPTVVLPRLRTAAELDALRRAADQRVEPATVTVGLLGAGPTDLVATAIEACRTARDEVADLDAVVVGAPDPGSDPWRRTRPELPDPAGLAPWTAVLWCGDPDPGARDREDLLTLALAGVPVVAAAATADAIGSLADRDLVVADPADPAGWAARLVELAERARRVATAIAGPHAAGLALDRVLGMLEAAR